MGVLACCPNWATEKAYCDNLIGSFSNTQPSNQAYIREQAVEYLSGAPPGTHIAIFALHRNLRLIRGLTTDFSGIAAALDEKNLGARPDYTSSMSLFSRSRNPPWLDSTREFCGVHSITIMGWGPQALIVEAKSPQRAAEISAQLAHLGFQPVPNPNDDNAGLLTLSHPD